LGTNFVIVIKSTIYFGF